MNTENGIVKYIKEDKHTKYMACAQYIDWILGNLVQNIREAYIVQEVYYINASDKEIKSVHYFEAWKIEDGICIKRDGQECDDIFSVGRPIDDSDTFKDSIGHEGIVAFIPRVFLVMGNSKLFDDIKLWPLNEVLNANGLPAKYYSAEVAKEVYKFQEFRRDPFCHKWSFKDPELVFKTVFNYCQKMFRSDSEIDRKNFKINIDDFFSEGLLLDVKKKRISEWDN